MKGREEEKDQESSVDEAKGPSKDGSSSDGKQPQGSSATSKSKGKNKEQKSSGSSKQGKGTQSKQGKQSSSQSGQQGKSQQSGQQGQFQQQKQQEQEGTALPEWIVFGVSLTLVVAVIITLSYLHFSGESGPPEIQVLPQLDEVDRKEAGYYLPVSVINVGGETAEDVSVTLTLTPPQGQPESKTYSIQFLSPREVDRSTVIFQSDPSQGTLRHVISFSNP